MYGSHLTETEYMRKLTAIWGEDYVDDLIDHGYMPVLTSSGWKMLLVRSPVVAQVSR